MTSPDKIKDWREELREYFDETLKAKKPTMKNLDRELLVDFVSNLLQARNREIIEKIKGMKKEPSEADDLAGNPSRWKISVINYNSALQDIITTLTGENNG